MKVEPGKILVHSTWSWVQENDFGDFDLRQMDEVFEAGAEAPESYFQNGKVLADGEAASYWDDYCGPITVRNVAGKAVFEFEEPEN